MKLIVGINKIEIDEADNFNSGEYNIHDMIYELDEVYNGLTLKATFSDGERSYCVLLENNHCIIPYEIFETSGIKEFGLFGYEVNGDNLVLRYSPTPIKKYVDVGSYKDSFDNYKQPTADVVEQLVARIEEAEAEVSEALEDISQYDTKIENLENNKVDKIEGKGLSTNDYTDNDQTKLSSIESNAQVNVIEDIKVNNTSQTISDKSVNINVPINTSDLNNNSGFITKNVNNLTYYTLKTNTGSLIDLDINSSTYVVTLNLKDQDGNVISSDNIDLPLESVVVGGEYDSINQKIVLTLENGNKIDIPVGALISGLQTEITSQNKLASDLVDDTNSGNKFTNTSEKSTWNAKYDKPVGGIPSTDLAETYVKPTDYATTSVGGVFKTSSSYGTSIALNGILQGSVRQYSSYSSDNDKLLICKGTLENVITGKDLTTKAYVDGLVGDINTALDTINGEVI